MEKVHEFLHNIIIFRRRDISERKRPSCVPVQYSFFQAFRPVRVRRGHYTIQPSQSQPSKMPFFFTRVIDFSLAHLVIQHRSVMRAPCLIPQFYYIFRILFYSLMCLLSICKIFLSAFLVNIRVDLFFRRCYNQLRKVILI